MQSNQPRQTGTGSFAYRYQRWWEHSSGAPLSLLPLEGVWQFRCKAVPDLPRDPEGHRFSRGPKTARLEELRPLPRHIQT